MDANAPFVTVVTPFYNTEEYLSECIESVLQQTYKNWEYVLLNNYSTDGSVQIAEHYAKLHPDRIRLEHNSVFLSQVENYNQVLRFMSPKSKYCKFVQADDMLFSRCLELMVDTAERDSSIGVVGSYALEGSAVEFDGLPYPSPMVNGREVCRLLFLDDLYLFGSPTQLLIRSDLVLARTPFFNESYYPFEDAVVMLEVLEHCNFGFVHQVLTFSRRHDGSVMKSLLALDCLIATRLFLLREFGQRFLEPEEYQVELKRKERRYAHVLVDGMVALRGKSFWEFHRGMRKRMGYTFKSTRTWWLFFVGLCDVLLNPKRTWWLFYNGLRRSKQ